MARSCGECTLCCKLLGVEELPKQPNTWCPHCNIGTGCRIYSGRPQSCRTFECTWLQETWIPEDLRPDRSKIVLSSTTDGVHPIFWVDPGYPDAWQHPRMAKFLQACKPVGVIIAVGNRRMLLSDRGLSNVLDVVPDGELAHLEVNTDGDRPLIRITTKPEK